MSQFSFEIDPLKVLGVTADASLEQIRDAYRQKAKRHHPTPAARTGCSASSTRRYELLCSARVVRAAHFEAPPLRRPPRPPRREPNAETVHAGLHDKDVDPARIVAVEHLCVRYLWDDASYLWLGQGVPDEERFLSCSLNLSWPDAARSSPARDPATTNPRHAGRDFRRHDHQHAGGQLAVEHREDRFAGWLSYSSFDRSSKALQTLHHACGCGLGLRQWARDLFLPRAWQFDRPEPPGGPRR